MFVPTFAAHKMINFNFFLNCLAAFLSFSLIASGVYIFNDFLDIDSDRSHPTKKNRPLANAQFDSLYATILMLALFLLGFFIVYHEGDHSIEFF